ncbi:hypothetical protein GBAR_LOCUS15829 [Geodia barretti]|uniref:EGF-like domain-containing protein n=1 Tax=Geodia barretti TaxID=519541 RepID=A0AA35WNE0_GEOBA|nr:hypothetical protein GBAR_LOCUS15829 [Geodia barretti]
MEVVLRLASVFVLWCISSSEAAFSRTMRCPCAASLATENWQPSVEEAVRLSDVVLMGRVVELRPGLRGTMNASVVTVYAYKGRAIFLSVIDNCTNFADGSDLNVVSLFFFAREPGGNLALRCVSPLQELHSATQGHLPALLNFVRDTGKQENKKNDKFVRPTPDPCLVSPAPCSPEGSFCSVTNTLTGHNYKCTCLTGFRGDGYNCQRESPTLPCYF